MALVASLIDVHRKIVPIREAFAGRDARSRALGKTAQMT
jgi:hypothetical protein